MGKKKLTKQDVIKVWKELDSKSEKPVGVNDLCRKMGIKPYHVTQLFQGKSLTELKQRHNIRISRREKPYTQDELFENYDRVITKYKKIPTWNQIKFETRIVENTYRKKFKKSNDLKRDIVEAYQKWLQKKKPTSPNLKVIDAFLKGDKKPTESQAETTQISRKKPTVYKKHEDRRTCGPPISFRNLVCEPINEQGVVFLFGMVCQELGFSAIEYIGIDFPDCEGKRLVSKGSRQQTVKIEFEYESKEFEKHCHDAQNCDLIVCWKHNWKKCPIEVIELSQVIKELSPAKR